MSNKLISLLFKGGMVSGFGKTGRDFMRRSLYATLAAALVFFPLNVSALGFGGIKLNSALNEPLDAEIDLLSATAADVDALQVRLASKESFQNAGVDRPGFLHQIKFKVERRNNGNYFIHLKTRQPVREPFLNFLLEMDWPNGRMLREYTVLLDPPDLFKKQPTVVEAPETTAPEAITREEPLPEPEALPEPQPEPIPEPALAPEPAAPEASAAAEPLPEPLPEPVPEAEPLVPPSADLSAPEETQPLPEPELVPEPTAQAAEEALPEPLPEPIPEEAPKAEMETEMAQAEPFTDDELFPAIPLSKYREPKESDYPELPGAAEPMAADTEMQAAEPMPEPLAGELDYGITAKGDSLWKIAEKLKGGDASIYQVMMALQQSNPDAFIGGNIHRLKVGQVMRINDPALLTAMSTSDAAAEYQRQTEAWNEYRQSVAAVDTTPQALVADGATESAEVAQTEPQGELTLESPSDGAQGAGVEEQTAAQNAALIALRDEVRLAMEQVQNDPNASPQQLAKLNTLKEELERLERMVAVKDDELAALQAQLSELNKARETPAEVAPEPTPTEPAQVAEVPDEAAIAPPAEESAAETTPAEGGTEQAAEAPTGSDEITPATGLDEGAVAEAQPEESAVAPGETAAVGQEPEMEIPGMPTTAEPGFVDMLMGWLGAAIGVVVGLLASPMMLAIVGAVLLILILAIIIIKRRRSVDGEESILTGESSAPVSVSTATEATSMEESSFLSDFAVSGMNAIQAEDTEVDPITEADVFMAYGRYEAAEERLQDAIRSEPGRNELKLKLIELYYTTKKKAEFENAAEELYAALGGGTPDDPNWEKVLGMGAEIAPENPLFSGAAEAGMSSESIQANQSGMTESEIMDIGLDTGIFSVDQLGGGEEINAAETMVTSADTLASMDAIPDVEEPAPADSGEADFDFGAGDFEFNLDSSDSSAEEPPTQADKPSSSPSETFDAGLELGESTPSEAFDLGGAAKPAVSEEFDANLGGGPALSEEFDLDMGAPAASQEFDLGMLDAEESADAGSSQELSLDMDTEAASVSEDSLIDLGLDSTDTADVDLDASVDEVGTKLDLAKAYIDMGDPEGARSILGEVLEEGDAGQKQEAEQLMQQIV